MFSNYRLSDGYYDEMFAPGNQIRPHYWPIASQLSRMPFDHLVQRQATMVRQMIKQGITFTLYNSDDGQSLERTIPFDIIPRIIPEPEWQYLQSGLKQRITALNRFIHDIYHRQDIVRAGLIPREMIVNNTYFRPEMKDLDPPGGVYCHLSGIDLVRDRDGRYYVLEDNLRTPSGISYVYKNRWLMQQYFPELFFTCHVSNIDYGLQAFLSSLRSVAPRDDRDPTVVLLTPGCYNSAYFEHTFLAQEMGIDLVEGRDLVVCDNKVYMRYLGGRKQVDVIYRRIDDDFLDPLAFRPDSLLGVPGLINAYRAGNVTICNAPGTGVADDKAIYIHVPDMIRFYLGEQPIISNVPTYVLQREEDRRYVLDHLTEMVVKHTSLSGGYGMLIGPQAGREELDKFRQLIIDHPEQYIAQPTLTLSTVPSLAGDQIVPRHVDLRPYIMFGRDENVHILPGGLTRVALSEGSLVVNSSQGGGSKDTWVTSP
ncbi:MAG: circularly permuted type 2 ATP-grasp protein [Negativicutes bacterium]|nr:circularly permuted type 2 ATP-grasp protein [Negativicutes bacterium]